MESGLSEHWGVFLLRFGRRWRLCFDFHLGVQAVRDEFASLVVLFSFRNRSVMGSEAVETFRQNGFGVSGNSLNSSSRDSSC